MKAWRKGLAVAGLLTALAGGAVAAPACDPSLDGRPLKVRQLQTELMVAALTCARHPTLDLPDYYNRFVRKFGDNLMRNAETLRRHFRSHHGAGHARAFDQFMTELANEASMRSLSVRDYCARSLPRFQEVLSLEPGELESYAERTVTPGRVTLCAAR